jgi:hypothetical protein
LVQVAREVASPASPYEKEHFVIKGVKSFGAVLLAGGLLAAAAPASADAAAYRHYVACGLSANAKPSHVCPKRGPKGAFFRSNQADVFYKVCVKFPRQAPRRLVCANRQEAERGALYVNRITSNIPGRHKVTWFVQGKRVGIFFFRIPG